MVLNVGDEPRLTATNRSGSEGRERRAGAVKRRTRSPLLGLFLKLRRTMTSVLRKGGGGDVLDI